MHCSLALRTPGVSALAIGLMLWLASLSVAADSTPPAQGEVPVLSPMVVTDKPSATYTVPNTTTATKTDTPLIETPVSIQVVPQQVLQDQQVTRLEQAVKNVSGVYSNNIFFGQFADEFTIRGFRTGQILYRDGFRINSGSSGKHELANIEQVEILKGPASILYGRIEPGGLVNYVIKQPLATRYYALEQQFGSFDFYRTTLDATGPLLPGGTLTYRLNAAYENSGSFRQFVGSERWFIAPVLQWNITPQTFVKLELDHFNNNTTPDNIGLIAFGNRPLNIPRDRNLGEPTDSLNAVEDILGLTLSHGFSKNWKVDFRFQAVLSESRDGGAFGDFVTDDDIRAGILPRTAEGSQTGLAETIEQFTYSTILNVTGKLQTWGIKHTLLLGGDYYENQGKVVCCGIRGLVLDDINIFEPVHGVTLGPVDTSFVTTTNTTTAWYGLYVQDQIELPHHIHILAGFRYDNAREKSSGSQSARDERVSPRVGLLWRPRPWLAVYGSYVENFGAANGTLIGRDDQPLPPETAQQWEVGLKTAFWGGRLSGTLAYFDLTKQNIVTADPLFPNDALHGLAIGEANSHGVELDVAGELLPGWQLLANYAYTETEILDDSFLGTAGNRLPNVPRHGGRVWSVYTLQRGTFKGLKLGGGVTFRDLRQGNLDNDFQLPGFATVDLVSGYVVQFGKLRASVQLNINNVLDEEYFESSADCCRSRIAPGTPRSFIGSLRAEF